MRTGDIGLLQTVFAVEGALFLAGGLVFGIALFRARVLTRWAAALLSVGGVVTAALTVMPDAFYRLLAFPNSVALIALGYSLWTHRAHRHHGTADRCRHPAPHSGRCRMTPRAGRWVPVGLVALAAIPVLGGAGRLVELLGGPEVLPTDARFAASPAPLVVHVVAAVVYAVLGAFQFSASLRRRRPRWHRRAGRLLVALGLAVALSGLWMTLLYPQQGGDGRAALPVPAARQLGDGHQHRPGARRHPAP